MELTDIGIIGQSTTLKSVFKTLQKVAPTDSTVLVTGESGTGKELVVKALHNKSLRKSKPFVPINCGAIPKELLESELFGHEKGAFTHAVRSRPGRFELAEGGTIFLDEIGEMDLLLQVKILRALQEREIERVGGTGTKKVDVRVIAATNRNLEEEVAAGRFREDLYYRLNVIPLHLPPLRERGADVLLLTKHFVSIFCAKKNRPALKIPNNVEQILKTYHWPGNVRELENLAERLSILCDGTHIELDDLPDKILSMVDPELLELTSHVENINEFNEEVLSTSKGQSIDISTSKEFNWPTLADMQENKFTLKEFIDNIEEKLIIEALSASGNVKNHAAEILGIKRTTLIEKLKKRQLE